MKKFIKLFAVMAMAILVTACGGNSSATLHEGIYQAMGTPAANGWTNFLTFTVDAEGNITQADYDSVNMMTGETRTKRQLAAAGEYTLAPSDKRAELGEIDQQYGAVAEFIKEHNGITATDTVAGATVGIDDAAVLFTQAKDAGPITPGTLPNGMHFATADAEPNPSGVVWTYMMSAFVQNGRILGVNSDSYTDNAEFINGLDWPADAGERPARVYKNALSQMDPSLYDLGANAAAPYYKQSEAINNWIIEHQGFGDVNAGNLTDGATDAIAGATIGISQWLEAFNKLGL